MNNYFCVVYDSFEQTNALKKLDFLIPKYKYPENIRAEEKLFLQSSWYPKTLLRTRTELRIYMGNVNFIENSTWINITNSLVKFENFYLKYLL